MIKVDKAGDEALKKYIKSVEDLIEQIKLNGGCNTYYNQIYQISISHMEMTMDISS